MTTTLRSSANGTKTRRLDEPSFELEPPTGGGRSRWPEITVGLLIIGIFALAGGWLYSNASTTEPVVALRSDMERGQPVTSNDLRVVEIGSEEALNLVGVDQSAALLGQVALLDLDAGTLVTPELFAAGASIDNGSGIVGMALDPGEYPTLAMRPGDRVRVVSTGGDDSQQVLAESAEVIDVASIGVQSQLFVSVAVTTEQADAIAAASADDLIRLIQVGGE